MSADAADPCAAFNRPGDIPRVVSYYGHPVPNAVVDAVNHMMRSSIVVANKNGRLEWRAYIDGVEINLSFDAAGKVIGSMID